MNKIILILAIIALPLFCIAQLTVQQGADLYLADGAQISVQGDVELQDHIFGKGVLTLNGTQFQMLNAHDNDIPRLFVHNRYGIQLTSSLKIGQSLVLESGNLQLGDNELELASVAVISANASAYVLTDGDGKLSKRIQKDLYDFLLPVGTATRYAPVSVSTTGTYSNGQVGASARSATHPHKPLSSHDYLQEYWTIGRSGITGEVAVKAFYNHVSGEAENLLPHYWNGHGWTIKPMLPDVANRTFVVDVPGGGGDIYAMHSGKSTQARYSIAVQPNPVRTTAHIVINSSEDENTFIRITDNSGATVMTKTVWVKKGSNRLSIDVSALASGQYIVSSVGNNRKSVVMMKQ